MDGQVNAALVVEQSAFHGNAGRIDGACIYLDIQHTRKTMSFRQINDSMTSQARNFFVK